MTHAWGQTLASSRIILLGLDCTRPAPLQSRIGMNYQNELPIYYFHRTFCWAASTATLVYKRFVFRFSSHDLPIKVVLSIGKAWNAVKQAVKHSNVSSCWWSTFCKKVSASFFSWSLPIGGYFETNHNFHLLCVLRFPRRDCSVACPCSLLMRGRPWWSHIIE